MAKFNASADLDKYSQNGKYFSLKNDGDKKVVRILYNTSADMDGYNVHVIKVNGYDTEVNCLRNYTDPLDACPLCEARKKAFVRFYVPIFDEETGETVIWKRGQNFYAQLTELSNKCNPLISYPVTIERHGKAGDIKTTYELYSDADSDGTTLEDLGVDIPDPVEVGALQDKTFEELTTYVQTGTFDGDIVETTDGMSDSSNNGVARRRRDVSAGGATATRRRASSNNDNSNVPW